MNETEHKFTPMPIIDIVYSDIWHLLCIYKLIYEISRVWISSLYQEKHTRNMKSARIEYADSQRCIE